MGYRSGFDLLLNVHQTRRFVEFTTSLCERDTNYAAITNSHRCFSLRTPLYSLFAYGRSGLRPSLVQGLRPRNAPLQKHASPTVCTLPQHRVWRTESTPPLAVSPHRPPTANHRCSTENKKLKTKNCSPGRPSIDYAIRYPEWQPARQAGQDRLPIFLSRCAQYKKSPPSGELCNRLIPAEEIRPTHKCPDGCLVIAGDASSIRYCRN